MLGKKTLNKSKYISKKKTAILLEIKFYTILLFALTLA